MTSAVHTSPVQSHLRPRIERGRVGLARWRDDQTPGDRQGALGDRCPGAGGTDAIRDSETGQWRAEQRQMYDRVSGAALLRFTAEDDRCLIGAGLGREA